MRVAPALTMERKTEYCQWFFFFLIYIYIYYIYGDAKVGGIVVLSSIVREFAKVKPKTMKNYEKKASEKL